MSTAELAKRMNLSERAIRAMQRWGAPFVARKSTPELLVGWLMRNAEKVRKID